MRRITLVLGITFILAVLCAGANSTPSGRDALELQSTSNLKQTDRGYNQLIGPVHVVHMDYERTIQSGTNKGKRVREPNKVEVYDRDGSLMEELSFGLDNCAMSRHIFQTDGTDRKSETVYWGKGILETNPPEGMGAVVFQVFTFDTKGTRLEVIEYDPAGQLSSKTRFNYDEKGRVKEITSDFGSSRSQCKFKYDQSGFIEEESCHRTGGFESAEKSSYKYETDVVGNWIKRYGDSATSFNGKATAHDLPVAYRTIEYYSTDSNSASEGSGTIGDLARRLGLRPCSNPLVIRKSGGVFQESATKRATPSYPAEALAQGIAGSVVIEITTGETGRVISVRSLSGPSELRAAAEEAAKRWEFAPTYLSKMPVKVIGTITFNFNR